ncbi:cysteine desulfurase NifS [Kosakonia radicincitans DSM 16656]|uniref:Cysteine desulfurase n=1 Tax=Kosakonia radicincitans TaxID=283686 RepID=A0AAX2ENU2_9ENTR|nr:MULTISPECIES: cysteine desulfurase NifS [Kosakonia]MDP9567082.1 cysteine desulfurase [Kosakonia oryzae]APG17998.1 cysteine desulfurase NifS [Kosakonia radicincitans]ARD60923.1 cysteine desulfurase NifS [Kosakonia radicincitans DSM 16656]KDE38267.1 cysteine desulfurase [Kosakonia radicincitans UMEnt01/12]MDD7995189.1 cysteine desulfurase NifS [Kosakonia radicincitans]
MKQVYLDNNATTRIDPMVLEAMMPFLTEHYGNPSSIHDFGTPSRAALERAHQQVAALLGADHASEIIFTSCATEATSTALHACVELMPERREIITTAVEHPATLAVCEHLERQGYLIHRIGVNSDGALDMEQYRQALSSRVAVVSVMWANNETGVLFPVIEMAAMAQEHGALFHCDAVQVVGKIPLDIGRTQIDMLSCSAHKLHGPKGVGCLYLRRGTRFRPLLRGGHQERGRRAGTENIAGIVGMGTACELAQIHLPGAASLAQLRDRLQEGLIAQVPSVMVMGGNQPRVPGTTNLAFEFIEGEAILLLLNQAGIAASSGSACTSGSLEPSHVMRAMNIPYTAAHGSIRFSLSRYTREKEIDYVIDTLPTIIARLRMLSPYWQEGKPGAAESAFAPLYG